MADFPAPGFTGSPLVRIDIERDNQPYFDTALANPKSRLLRLDGLSPVIGDDGGLSWGSLAEADPEAPLALLGLIDDAPRFVSLSRIEKGGPDPRMAMIQRCSPKWIVSRRCCVPFPASYVPSARRESRTRVRTKRSSWWMPRWPRTRIVTSWIGVFAPRVIACSRSPMGWSMAECSTAHRWRAQKRR